MFVPVGVDPRAAVREMPSPAPWSAPQTSVTRCSGSP
jgi:hypothetical protein